MTEQTNLNFEIELDIKQNSENSNDVTVNGWSRENILTSKTKNLSHYELVAKPRIIRNPKEIEINHFKLEKIINEIFTCTICRDIFTDPVNSKNCLHKFCKDCIKNYILSYDPNNKGKKECPICRFKLENKRVLRDDTRIKEIMNQFIPDTDKFRKKADEYNCDFAKNLTFKKIQEISALNNEIAKQDVIEQKLKVKEITGEYVFNNTNNKIKTVNNLNNNLIIANINTSTTKNIGLSYTSISNLNVLKNETKENILDQNPNDSDEDKLSNYENSYTNYNNNFFNNYNESHIPTLNRKKTHRAQNEIDSDYDVPYHNKRFNKKMKIDSNVHEYYITKEEMDTHINKKTLGNNFVEVNLCSDNLGSVDSLFNNMKLITNDDITLNDFSTYLANKRKLNFKFVEKLSYYIKDNAMMSKFLNKTMTLRDIKELLPENQDHKINLFVLISE